MRTIKRPFAEWEDAAIRAAGGRKTSAQVAAEIGRDRKSVESRARRLGVTLARKPRKPIPAPEPSRPPETQPLEPDVHEARIRALVAERAGPDRVVVAIPKRTRQPTYHHEANEYDYVTLPRIRAIHGEWNPDEHRPYRLQGGAGG